MILKNKKLNSFNKNKFFLISVFTLSILFFFLSFDQASAFTFTANGITNAEIREIGELYWIEPGEIGGIIGGDPVVLSWNVPGATSCSIGGGGIFFYLPHQPIALPTGSTTTAVYKNNTVFTMSCTFPSGCGSASRSVTVAVESPVPTLTFSVYPEAASPGDTVLLTWSSTSTISCSVPCPVEAPATSGTCSIVLGGLPTETIPRSFNITCSGHHGSSITGRVNVRLIDTGPPGAPTITFGSVSPSIYSSGQYVTLTWSAVNTHGHGFTCNLGWRGWTPTGPTGSDTIWVDTTRTFVISCCGPGGSSRSRTTVTVLPRAPTGIFTITPDIIQPNQTATVNWNISYVDDNDCVLRGSGFWGWGTGTVVPAVHTTTTPALAGSNFYTLTCNSLSGFQRFIVGYVVQNTDITAPTAMILAASYLDGTLPPHGWWNRDFKVPVNFADDRALACCLVRTAWRSEEAPRAYTPTPWVNHCSPGGMMSSTSTISMTVRSRFSQIWASYICQTQGKWACKIEVKAIDMAGNESPLPIEEKFFNIDWTSPVIEIKEVAP